MKDNFHNFIDIKLSAMLGVFTAVTFSDVDVFMRVIVFLLTAGYTIDRWIYLRKKDKKE